jgi:hypothetical protein
MRKNIERGDRRLIAEIINVLRIECLSDVFYPRFCVDLLLTNKRKQLHV